LLKHRAFPFAWGPASLASAAEEGSTIPNRPSRSIDPPGALTGSLLSAGFALAQQQSGSGSGGVHVGAGQSLHIPKGRGPHVPAARPEEARPLSLEEAWAERETAVGCIKRALNENTDYRVAVRRCECTAKVFVEATTPAERQAY